ncbi:primase-helicase family protein [Methylovirgula sp. HY1]|uniref:primase-helicase family protein n=1 Tax=Methylovirgula sp. HY1 TaxID=2822761 RepID=UPI001C5AB54E|nr:primase-helicase family protein [Methylovirgula sp. HY1]QXX74253.1 hypothetical protein MHY1_01063 [Methylovirgula sp. HY1]
MTQDPDDIAERIESAEILAFPEKRNATLSDDQSENRDDPALAGKGEEVLETDAGGDDGGRDGDGAESDDDDPIAVINREWALVLMGSRAVVMRERPDAPIEDRTRVLSIEAFKNYLLNCRVKVKKRVRDEETDEWVEKTFYYQLAPYWLKARDRRTYDGIEFFPDPDNKPGTRGYFNLWRGFSVKPDTAPTEERAKKYQTFRDHLFTNICNANKEHFDWLFAWMAHIGQKPRERPGTAIVMRGLMGTGKTIVGEILGKLFESHYFLVDDPRYVTGQFNAHMASCLLLQVDEGFWAGDKAAEGRLKGLITAPKQMIEAKGIDPIRVDNHVRLMFSSNEHWVVPAAMDERRFCVFDVADHAKENFEYFAEIHREMNEGGREAFLADLLALDLDVAPNVRVIPKTSALLEQKIRSFDPITAWLFERVMDGAITKRMAHWPKWVAISTAHNDYLRQVERQGVRRRANVTEFALMVRRLLPGIAKKRRIDAVEEIDDHGVASTVHRRVWCWDLPSLEECRAALEAALRQAIDWDDAAARESELPPADL